MDNVRIDTRCNLQDHGEGLNQPPTPQSPLPFSQPHIERIGLDVLIGACAARRGVRL